MRLKLIPATLLKAADVFDIAGDRSERRMIDIDIGQTKIGADALGIESIRLQLVYDQIAADGTHAELVGFCISHLEIADTVFTIRSFLVDDVMMSPLTLSARSSPLTFDTFTVPETVRRPTLASRGTATVKSTPPAQLRPRG